MRIVIDILHPAHAYFFRNFYFCMQQRGHQLLVTARRKDRATEILERLGIPFQEISHAARGRCRQALEFLWRSWKFARLVRGFQPDVLTGIMGPTIAVVGKALGCPAYVFYDTECAQTTNRFAYPLASRVITPSCYQGSVGPHHATYPGYHELAYLHPQRFQPDKERVRRCGVDPDSPFAVVRFVGWWATHDRGERGLSREQKVKLVQTLKKRARVLVSSEAPLPPELADDVYQGPVEDMHHLLAFANLYYGESATMASEAAVLGTPAIYLADTGRGYTDDQARYGLVHRFHRQQYQHSLDTAEAILRGPDEARMQAAAARQRMLQAKIDVTDYMIALFEQGCRPNHVSPIQVDDVLAAAQPKG